MGDLTIIVIVTVICATLYEGFHLYLKYKQGFYVGN